MSSDLKHRTLEMDERAQSAFGLARQCGAGWFACQGPRTEGEGGDIILHPHKGPEEYTATRHDHYDAMMYVVLGGGVGPCGRNGEDGS
jgi:hypothetical protein